MKLTDIMTQIEKSTEALKKKIGEDAFITVLENKLEDDFLDFSFTEEDVETLKEYEKLTLFSFELRTPEENSIRFYTDACLLALAYPLMSDGKTSFLSMSVRFGEWEEGDIDINDVDVYDEDSYKAFMYELCISLGHQFKLFRTHMQEA